MSAENKGISWREAIDLPEYIGLGGGAIAMAVGFALAGVSPALAVALLEGDSASVVTSATSLGVTRAAIPYEKK